MKRTLRILIVAVGSAVVLASATVSRAAESGSSAEQNTGVAFKWVHFLILAAALVYIVRRYGRPHFRSQADSISAAISKAAAAKAEAERRLRESEAKLSTLEKEMAQFRKLAQQEAAAELQRLRAMTQVDADKIGIAAKAEIEAAERAARVELKALAAKLAVERAEALVSKELTPAVQEAMLNHFVQSLQGRPN